MLFLETRSGLVAAKHVVRIEAVNTRPTGDYHRVDYVHGGEPRETTATAEAVERFVENCDY